MANRLLVAAGGGGDDLAAVVIQRATAQDGERAYFASYSWERLFVDPVPGPRDPSWFEGLEALGRRNYRITADTRAKPPAQSLLPRLVAELGADFFLLDPREGAVGLREQLRELATLLDLDVIQLVDVGGDILARGDEPGLRSPLADSLSLAAAVDVGPSVEVLVAGAGLDGELTEREVLQRCSTLGGERYHHLSREDTSPFLDLLHWYPSEVTGLLILAAQGYRGTAELRDGGLLAELTNASTDVYRFDHGDVHRGNNLAHRMLETRALSEVETALQAADRESDLEYERRKAKGLASSDDSVDVDAVLAQLRRLEPELIDRGVSYLALRRIADFAHLSSSQLSRLRLELACRRHPRYQPPVWLIRSSEGGRVDTNDRDVLAREFGAGMERGYELLKDEYGYNATRFLLMLREHGGVQTAKHLLHGSDTSYGLEVLTRHQALEHSLEAWVVNPRFEELFTTEEIAVARRRLELHGFDVDSHLRRLWQDRDSS